VASFTGISIALLVEAELVLGVPRIMMHYAIIVKRRPRASAFMLDGQDQQERTVPNAAVIGVIRGSGFAIT
jgi:hypothetical protein